MVVGVAVAVFSVAMLSTLTAGIDTAARATVGADLRVTAPYLSQDQLSAIAAEPGVTGVAPVYAEVTSTLTIDGATRTVSVLVVDADELRAVQRGVPGALDLPSTLNRTHSASIPVVLSSDLAALLENNSEVESNGSSLDVVATAPSTGPLTVRRAWLIVDRANADELVVPDIAPGVALVRLADSTHPEAMAHGLATLLGPAATVAVPSALASAAAAVPSAGGLSVALLVAVVVAWLLSGAAIVPTLVLGAPGRDRMLSLLSSLGLGRRGARTLIGWEIGPATVAAAVVGGLVGAALPFIVLAGIDLRPFTVGAVQPAVVYDPALMAAAVAAFALVVTVGVWVAMTLARRVDAATMLRTIEEG
jgi:putative ABC transport system permease protein